ncbi:MAG: transporter substrate-binding domain-containing protein [Rhodobiaceae bacterium]|nr:transporter substrate-binding domain-containing protein [Rhodobiaceae bacterium]
MKIENNHKYWQAVVCMLPLALALVLGGHGSTPAAAQAADGIFVPGFWDPNRRFPKPDRSKVRSIRFLTELESPPFSFTAPDGLPAGFNVDLARAVCGELDIPCTIQELKWDLLVEAIAEGRGDAIIAPIPITAETRKTYAFTNPFLGRPGRFVATKTTLVESVSASAIAGRKVAVVAGTPHETFLKTYFPQVEIASFDNTSEARKALTGGAVELMFSDALAASVWLNSAAAKDCCIFIGDAYADPHFFGEGIAVAVDPARRELREAIDFAMSRIYQDGRYFEIFLRYFPRGYY